MRIYTHGDIIVLCMTKKQGDTLKFMGDRDIIIPDALRDADNGPIRRRAREVEEFQFEIQTAFKETK